MRLLGPVYPHLYVGPTVCKAVVFWVERGESWSSCRRPTEDLQTPGGLKTPSLGRPKWALLVLRRPKGVLRRPKEVLRRPKGDHEGSWDDPQHPHQQGYNRKRSRTLRTLSPRHPYQEGSNRRRPKTLRTLAPTRKGSTPCKMTRRVQEATTRVHEETTRVHEETTRVHEATTRVHKATTRVLEETTRVHEETTRVHEATTRVHKATTRVHEETTRVHEATTRVHEATSRVPEPARGAHETTSRVPEATSRVLETTTRGPKTTQWTQNHQQQDEDDNFRPASLDLLFYYNKLSWVGLGHLARGVGGGVKPARARKRPRLSGNSSGEDSSSQNRQQWDNQQDEDDEFRPASLDLLLFLF